jgi:hypothetical protein
VRSVLTLIIHLTKQASISEPQFYKQSSRLSLEKKKKKKKEKTAV